MSKTIKIRLPTLVIITALLVACSDPTPVRAHAIILFIGDGMGEAHRTAGRWQALGQDGTLAMDAMEFSSWTSTADVRGFVTDSAAAGTALATGTKTRNGVIGQDVDGNRLTTILEQAQARGMAVGLVSNTAIAHATPAAFAAHVSDREMTTEIADQMVTAKVDVLLGGGESDFLPPSITGCYPGYGYRWEDERDLIAEAVDNGYTYVCSAAELAAVDPTSTTRLLGLFGDGGITRPFFPTLAEMTQRAISVLSQDPDGFFLMVEGGQIDWAAHDNDAANVISDVIELDEAVAVAQAYAATVDNVLIIVTADHETGGMSVSLTADGSFSEDGPFSMPNETSFYVNWSSGNHTEANVPTTAQGPCASLLAEDHENTHIHDVMQTALDACP
jgi:alkaline phosphatase